MAKKKKAKKSKKKVAPPEGQWRPLAGRRSVGGGGPPG